MEGIYVCYLHDERDNEENHHFEKFCIGKAYMLPLSYAAAISSLE